MSAPLLDCTKEEMRAVIRFLHSEGVKSAEIIRRMQEQYGASCLSHGKIYQWIKYFKNGRISIKDEERSGRPCTSKTKTNIETVERMIRDNKRVKIDEIANKLNISHGSVFSIIHKSLKVRKIHTCASTNSASKRCKNESVRNQNVSSSKKLKNTLKDEHSNVWMVDGEENNPLIM